MNLDKLDTIPSLNKQPQILFFSNAAFDLLIDSDTNEDPMISLDNYKAKPGQKLLLHRDICKNLLFVMLPYLKCYEVSRLLATCKSINHKLNQDPYLKVVLIEAYQVFFM